MSSNDDFVHVSTDSNPQASSGWGTSGAFFDNAQGKRCFTEGVIVESLTERYPKYHLTVTQAYSCDLLAFADSRGDTSYTPLNEKAFVEQQYRHPSRRYNDETGGSFVEKVIFGSFNYVFQENTFLVYTVEGADGLQFKSRFNYILVAPKQEGVEMTLNEKESAKKKSDVLIAACSTWMQELHNEVLVFDQGYWQKNKELWQNIQKSNWDDVILEQDKKEAIIGDVLGFFDGEQRYAEFGVPWKRGVIFHGPPGNGKTISTKALMHDISKRKNPAIESLYVKSFNSYGGPEQGIRQIFIKARQMAPCILIFEDIDSLVNVAVRSYFLNEVDGLESNHGILMIGSTNHLERLDPGISKRPSRFDRKYFFDVPNRDERIQYCEYWRHKLRNNDKVDFPREMCIRVADITEDFSFAYMKEAFVAALLVLAAKQEEKKMYKSRDDNLADNVLWRELKKQIDALRKEMNGASEICSSKATNNDVVREVENGALSMGNEFWPAMSGILDNGEPQGTRPIDIRNNIMPRYM